MTAALLRGAPSRSRSQKPATIVIRWWLLSSRHSPTDGPSADSLYSSASLRPVNA